MCHTTVLYVLFTGLQVLRLWLHPTEGESKQTKPSESDFGKERWSGVGGDAPAGKVAGTDSLSMEENVGRGMAGQSETGDGRRGKAVLDHVLSPIGAAVEEEQVFRVKKLVGRQWGAPNSNYLLAMWCPHAI